ncbi:MAG: hypothetical protein R3C53_16535 [Pirellulaceae bacterium]
MMDWILWMAGMLALVIATAIAALREKSARAKAMKAMAPQPQPLADEPVPADGFGEADPLDGFA